MPKAGDVVLCVLTTRFPAVMAPTDYELQDWSAAGLHSPSVLRVYIGMALRGDTHGIGHLSERDWEEGRARLRIALVVT